jgi:hypothetical protein
MADHGKARLIPGPVIMLHGLQKFELKYEGWLLAQ